MYLKFIKKLFLVPIRSGDKFASPPVAADAHLRPRHGPPDSPSVHQDIQDDSDVRLLLQADLLRHRAQVQGVQVQVPQGVRGQGRAVLWAAAGATGRIQEEVL